MQSQHEESEDIFFDSLDFISASFNPSSEESLAENSESESEPGNFDYKVWMTELRSISERRVKFLHRMGFNEFVASESCQSQEIREVSCDVSSKQLELDRLTETGGAVLDSLGCSNDREKANLHCCCINDLDRGKKFIVHELGKENILSTTLREVDSGKLITWEEFEMSLGFSHSVQQLMLKNSITSGEKRAGGIATREKKPKSWWKGFPAGVQFRDLCKCSVPVQVVQLQKAGGARVHHHGKRCKEFMSVSMAQEFQAHKGSIWTMKFSPDGRYLATGGEDCTVRIWCVKETKTPDGILLGGCAPKFVDNVKEEKLLLKSKHPDSDPVAIPRKTFKLEETPLHEFRGHTSDILDLSWSESNCLLTSSKDKTVRMWQVGHDHCLKVFQHNNYVTCIQFDPVDDDRFISGSIDGKARIWEISEYRVIDWVDIRDIVTAVCYRPDAQGFIVGSITGKCRFYYLSGNSLQLDAEFSVQGRKKTTGKRIIGFQFTSQDPEKVMITSADAKVRIFDGFNVIHKYRGHRKSSQLCASFTSDGRYIVSVGEDSHVYVWNYSVSGTHSSEGAKSVRPCEDFFSKDACVAVPWPGMDYVESGRRNCSPLLQAHRSSGASAWLKDAERFSLGAWFFADCPSRVAATWPEEKIFLWGEPAEPIYGSPPHGLGHRQSRPLRPHSANTWSRVVVTAGHDGAIRSFYHGLPVRL